MTWAVLAAWCQPHKTAKHWMGIEYPITFLSTHFKLGWPCNFILKFIPWWRFEHTITRTAGMHASHWITMWLDDHVTGWWPYHWMTMSLNDDYVNKWWPYHWMIIPLDDHVAGWPCHWMTMPLNDLPPYHL